MNRAELDAAMREVLVQLAVCSHVPATSYQPRGRSGATDSRDLSGGDVGTHTHLAREYGPPFHDPTTRWPGAKTDEDRAWIIERARRELENIRGTGVRARPLGETAAERDHRIVHGAHDPKTGKHESYEGWSPEDVAMNTGVTAAHVRKLRVRATRDQETGRPIDVQALPAAERRRRARELDRSRVPIAEIARRLGTHRSTIERDIGRRAA